MGASKKGTFLESRKQPRLPSRVQGCIIFPAPGARPRYILDSPKPQHEAAPPGLGLLAANVPQIDIKDSFLKPLARRNFLNVLFSGHDWIDRVLANTAK